MSPSPTSPQPLQWHAVHRHQSVPVAWRGRLAGAAASRRLGVLLTLLVATGLAAMPVAAEPGDTRETLRVGTSGDYPPFSRADEDGRFEGFDLTLARRYAEERGLALEIVRFRWPRLADDLAAARFDLAMSGVTVRPERSARFTFTVPVLETGAVVLLPSEGTRDLDALDRSNTRIGVNAGGHLERVAHERFPNATIIAIPDNTSVMRALDEAAVDAVVTDVVEARLWRAERPALATLGPFTRDRKALLVAPDRTALSADLDAWLLAREADGSLAALRREWFGDGPWRPVARPLDALLAAVDERLSLMPTVAIVKRESGEPLEVPEREHLVLDAAVERVLEAAHRADVVPPSVLLIRHFFGAQLEAAKQIQRDAVRGEYEADPDVLPDLDADLRPALLRIGERIARLLVALPPGTSPLQVHAAVERELRAPHLAPSSRRAIADALVALLPKPEPQAAPAQAAGRSS